MMKCVGCYRFLTKKKEKTMELYVGMWECVVERQCSCVGG